jgi:hypothetical protein
MKLVDNMAALRLLKYLDEVKRPAPSEEQGVLARYNGWGGLALAFEPNPRDWKPEAEELKTLLTPEEYRSARATVNTAFSRRGPLLAPSTKPWSDLASMAARRWNPRRAMASFSPPSQRP